MNVLQVKKQAKPPVYLFTSLYSVRPSDFVLQKSDFQLSAALQKRELVVCYGNIVRVLNLHTGAMKYQSYLKAPVVSAAFMNYNIIVALTSESQLLFFHETMLHKPDKKDKGAPIQKLRPEHLLLNQDMRELLAPASAEQKQSLSLCDNKLVVYNGKRVARVECASIFERIQSYIDSGQFYECSQFIMQAIDCPQIEYSLLQSKRALRMNQLRQISFDMVTKYYNEIIKQQPLSDQAIYRFIDHVIELCISMNMFDELFGEIYVKMISQLLNQSPNRFFDHLLPQLMLGKLKVIPMKVLAELFEYYRLD